MHPAGNASSAYAHQYIFFCSLLMFCSASAGDVETQMYMTSREILLSEASRIRILAKISSQIKAVLKQSHLVNWRSTADKVVDQSNAEHITSATIGSRHPSRSSAETTCSYGLDQRGGTGSLVQRGKDRQAGEGPAGASCCICFFSVIVVALLIDLVTGLARPLWPNSALHDILKLTIDQGVPNIWGYFAVQDSLEETSNTVSGKTKHC